MQFSKWVAGLKERSISFFTKSSQQVKQTAKNMWDSLLKHKKIAIPVSTAALLTVSLAAFGNYYYQSNIYSIYHVIVNGKEVGVVNDPDVIHKWSDKKLAEETAKHIGLTLKLSDYITFTEEKLYKGKYDNDAAIQALDKIAEIKVEAVKLVVNGETIGYAANEEAAATVLEDVKEKFSGVPAPAKMKKQAVMAASLEAPANNNIKVKEVKFKENVQTETDEVPAAQVLSVDKLEELITKGTFKQVTHTVAEGDCITCIAKKYDITSKDIYANNPGITENTVLKLGQQINVTAIRPLVTVQVVEQVTKDEVIDYSTEIQSNDKVPKGEQKVLQEGKEGKKAVTYEVIKENGQVIDNKMLSQTVLANPVPKIVERGTKVIPSRGTGRLSWPAPGYVSSGFGTRWGRLHAGIDIAGPGSVKAADNGRVIEAGWHGDYGNCVIIDHGNGLQTLYAHMSSVKVKVGDVVAQGKVIGVKGATGDATGVHLHFEVRKNGTPQNPMKYLSR